MCIPNAHFATDRSLTRSTLDHTVQHEQLVHVEQDPWQVADEEDDDDAEEDGGQVHLGRLLLVVLARALVGHPDAAEDAVVEEHQREHWGNT